MGEITVRREGKDRLFRFIFGRSENKKWALSLYNAINETEYDDPSEIEINTMEDVIYMGMKNDVSYIFRDMMNIFEHQSTVNPNIPIRELMYVGHLYDKYIQQHRLNIYGRKQIELPVPRLVVFYNGADEAKDDSELFLSDAFQESVRSFADIYVRVRMLNINYGHNRQILDSCRVLNDYAWFVKNVRGYSEDLGIEKAVDKAIDEMAQDSELKEFLVSHRSEVKMSCLTEYDEAATMKAFAEEASEEARAEGLAQGLAEGRVAGEEKKEIENIRTLMETLNFSETEAMEALRISDAKQKKYMTML